MTPSDEPATAGPAPGKHVAYLLVVLLYALVAGATLPPEPVHEPDSASYVGMSSSRSAGYPLLIAGLQEAGLSLDALPVVQLALFCACLAFLGFATLRVTASAAWPALLVAGIAANPFLAEYHALVLTESVFISLTLVVIGLLALYLARPGWRSLAACGAVMGLAVAVRPVGYALLPLLPFAALLAPAGTPRERTRALVAALVAALALVAVEAAVHRAHHGPERDSLLPRHLFAKAALVGSDAASPFEASDPRRAVWQAVAVETDAVRALIADAPAFGAATHILSTYEIYFQYRYANDLVAAASDRLGLPADAVRESVAWPVLRSAPGDYLALAAFEFASQWTLFAASHPHRVGRLADYLAASRPLPFEGAGGYLDEELSPAALGLVVQPAIIATGLLGAALVGLALMRWLLGRRPGPALATAVLCVLMTNGNFALVALTGIATPRYTLAMWPAMVAYAAFGAIALVAWRRDRRRGAR